MLYRKKRFSSLQVSLDPHVIQYHYHIFKNTSYCIFSKLLHSLYFHAINRPKAWKERGELTPFSFFLRDSKLSTSLKISCKFTTNVNSHLSC